MSSPMPTGWVEMEDGSRQRVAFLTTNYSTFAEAQAALDRMPEGPAKAAAQSKLYDAVNEHSGRIMGGALQTAARYDNEITTVDRQTDEQLTAIRELTAKLGRGEISALDAGRAFDAVIRSQTSIDKHIQTWRDGIARAASHFADPLAAHDEMVRRMPKLREGRPLVSF